MSIEELKLQLRNEQESIEMMVIAYQVKQLKKVLDSSSSFDNEKQKEQYIHDEFKQTLQNIDEGQAFSPEQAERIVNRYTPIAALDSAGAGAILLRDNTDNQIIGAIRGADLSNVRNAIVDGGADTGIAFKALPVYQTTLIDNFIARETAAAGTSVAQITFDQRNLQIERTTDAIGTGRAQGQIKYIAGHSEGGPESQTMGVRHGANVWTLNAPGVDHTDVSAYIEQTARLTGMQPPQGKINSTHIDTTGISIISQPHRPSEKRTGH